MSQFLGDSWASCSAKCGQFELNYSAAAADSVRACVRAAEVDFRLDFSFIRAASVVFNAPPPSLTDS